MQKTELTNSLAMMSYNEVEYIRNHKEINDNLLKISGNFATEYINNLNGDIFVENKKLRIYILKQNRTAISFAIFKTINNTATLEMICTQEEYLHLGFATILLRAVAIDLQKCNIRFLNFDKDEQNQILQNIIFSFSKVEGIDVAEDNEKFVSFDILNVNQDKLLNDIKHIAF